MEEQQAGTPRHGDLLLRWLIGVAIGLAVLQGILGFFFGSGPMIAVLPWYVPMMHSFLALAAISIAFLSVGRYRVLREPASFWIGAAFSAFAVLAIFYVLAWPGLLPDDQGLIARLPNTAGWLWNVKFTLLGALLLVAPALSWPRSSPGALRWWARLIVAGIAALIVFAVLSLRFEEMLPRLVLDGFWTPFQVGWLYVLLALFAGGAALSVRHHRRVYNVPLGFVAIVQLLLAFAILTGLIGGKRYDLWWYMQRLLTVGGFSTMLFGLLAQYVALYRTADERAGELAATIESMADAVVVADRQGRIRNVNQAALDMLGRSRHEVVLLSLPDAASLLQLRYPDARPVPTEENVLLAALQGQATAGHEGILRRADGRDVHFSMSAAPVHDRVGHVVMAVAVVRDVTELRNLERLRDEFLSTAAHELKTPVTTIKGYAQMLGQWEAHDTREAAAFAVVNRQCDRISRLVQELLEVSRLQLGRLELHKVPFELGDLAAEVVERMQETTTTHRLVLLREAAAPVEADRERMDQVFANLLDNAMKFSPEGGEIVTTVGARSREAVVSVRDAGIGIPRDKQAHIFERFYRAHAGTLNDFGGMGIGLHITREIVTRHGGEMWFESEEGGGSTFYFSLPLASKGQR